MSYLADTNFLLRWVEFGAPERPLVVNALNVLRRRGEVIAVTPQNLIEFWAVATRPTGANGLGFSPDRADRGVRRFERVFPVLPDIATIFEEWRRLVVAFGVRGRQVYDARLVAVMMAHGISHLLTFDTADFARYPGITVVHPRDLAPTP